MKSLQKFSKGHNYANIWWTVTITYSILFIVTLHMVTFYSSLHKYDCIHDYVDACFVC